MSVQDWVPLAKDIITALVALGGLMVAVSGLTTWRRQMKGRTQYDVARRLLHAAYHVREATRRVRSPWVPGAEQDQAAREAGYELKERFPDRIHDREPYVLAIMARLRDLHQKLADFSLEALEAEVILGKERVRTASDHLLEAANAVSIAVQQHLADEKQRSKAHGMPEGYDERITKAFGLVGESDELKEDVRDALEKLEDVARPHLD